MADYKQEGNRYTAIYVIESNKGGKRLLKRHPFDLVRFNVDTNPDAPQEIVPVGQQTGAGIDEPQKLYEDVWIVEVAPWHPGRGGTQDFGPAE
jgi:hypothetical protein